MSASFLSLEVSDPPYAAVCWLFIVNLIQARVIWEEEIFIDKMLPSHLHWKVQSMMGYKKRVKLIKPMGAIHEAASPWPLHQFLRPGSCLKFLSCLSLMTDCDQDR